MYQLPQAEDWLEQDERALASKRCSSDLSNPGCPSAQAHKHMRGFQCKKERIGVLRTGGNENPKNALTERVDVGVRYLP